MKLYGNVPWYALIYRRYLEIPKWPPLSWKQGERLTFAQWENSLKLYFLKEYKIKSIKTLLIYYMACPKVAPVFGISEMVTVTMETAKISKISKCSKRDEILQQC